MANITLLGASYTDVPAVTLPQTGGGTVTFYENGGGLETVTIFPSQTVTATDVDTSGYVIYLDSITENLIDDTNYIVTLDGTPYLCFANTIYGSIYAGDLEVVWGNPANSIYPFAIGSYANNRTQWMVGDNSPHTVKIERVVSMSGGTNQDYEDALTAFGVQSNLANGITALTTYANEITGESDTTLSDAVRSLADGYGQGGEEETGTFTASGDSNPTILFSNSHTKAPAIIILMRVDTASSMPVLCGIFYVFTNAVDLFGVSLQTTQKLFRQGVHAYARTKSNGEAELGAAVLADTSTRVTTTGFTPYFGSANHVCRSGCTYKWIAIWTQGN